MAQFFNYIRSSPILFPRSCTRILSTPSITHFHSQRTMSKIAEMRRSTFQENLIRILRTEMNYDIELRCPKEPIKEFGGFTVDSRPGKQYLQLRKKHNEKEDIKVDATMFDGFISGESGSNDVKHHISLVVDIIKGEGDNVLQFICSAWPSTMGIEKVFQYQQQKPVPIMNPFMGPDFKDMDEDLQESLLEYLEERGINDDLAVFLHDYVVNKDVCEHVRWMGNIKAYLEK